MCNKCNKISITDDQVVCIDCNTKLIEIGFVETNEEYK